MREINRRIFGIVNCKITPWRQIGTFPDRRVSAIGAFILLSLIFGQFTFAQDSKSERFTVGINSFVVTSNQRPYSNFGMGVNAAYRLPLIKKIGIDGTAMLGLDKLMLCRGICKSEWYPQPFWWGVGLSKSFEMKNNSALSLGLRSRWFGFNRTETMYVDSFTGETVEYAGTTGTQLLYGLQITYRIPGNLPIEIGLAADSGNWHTMGSFSAVYRF